MLDIISAIRHSRAEVPVGLMPTSKDSALSESSRGGQIEVYRSLDDVKTQIEHGRRPLLEGVPVRYIPTE
jgi:hypothetical protein